MHKLSEMDKMSNEPERIAQLGDEIAERQFNLATKNDNVISPFGMAKES